MRLVENDMFLASQLAKARERGESDEQALNVLFNTYVLDDSVQERAYRAATLSRTAVEVGDQVTVPEFGLSSSEPAQGGAMDHNAGLALEFTSPLPIHEDLLPNLPIF